MIKVIYNKACGRCVQSEPLTSGMVGQPIHFEYSHDFDGLAATAVFTDGKNTVNVVNPGNECVIPHEVLTTVGAMVKVGIYAVKGDELVIPTVYATIGFVLKGADPNGGISEDPTLPVWAQTQAMIGNLSALDTQAKDNLVLAINEVKQTADSKQDTISDLEAIRTGAAKGATALQSVPNSYRTAAAQDVIDNGLSDRVSAIEGKEAGWNGKYSKPTDGIPKTDLAQDVQNSLSKANTALQEHQSLAAYRTAEAQDLIDSTKQDKLIAGENITIAEDGKTISATGGSSVPKPLTYDYMPEGYPTKSVQTTTLMEEQEVEFVFSNDLGVYWTHIQQSPLAIAEGKTYTVNWDGTEYECVCFVFNSIPAIGNLSIFGVGDDTGEPFAYEPDENAFITLNPSPTHTISVKTTAETITPMAEEFIPHMNVSAFTNDSGYVAASELADKQDKLIAGENITIAADGKTISATGSGTLPKPLTYDYMPEGYPKKSMQTTVLMGEQEVAFTDDGKSAKYYLTDPLDLVEGQTYTVKWDGTEYECVCGNKSGVLFVGNLLYADMGEDSGEPFLYDTYDNAFATFDASPSHTISVKTSTGTITPMSAEFIPPMNVSAFTNDAGYLTLATLPKYEGVVE